jgi:general secretion pathway protein D
VIPKAKASGAPVPLYTEPVPADGSPLAQERTVTEILELAHAPVSEVKAALTTLLPEGSSVLEHTPTNKLILTTTVRSLARLRRVIDELDVVVPGKTVHLLPVHHRSATELAKQVQEVLTKEELEKRVPKTKEHEATRPALLADPAHNMLVVVATVADFARIRRLVAQVDRDPDPGPAIEFLRLHHAEPGEVVKKVQDALKVEGVGDLPPYSMVPDERTQTIMLRTPSENLRTQIREAVRRLDEEGESLEAARVRVYHLNFAEAKKVADLLGQIDFAGEASAMPTTGAAKAGTKDRDLVKVVADENTNSLVITAPRGLFEAIDQVIRQLDVVKPQVMVEVLIAEVDYDWAKGVGLDFSFLNEMSSDTNRTFGVGNTGTVAEAAAGGMLPSGLNVGLLHGQDFDLGAALSGDASELSKIAVLMRLFEGTNHANILSSPTLFTSDNETARIAIGERIQLPASFATAANTGLNTVTSFNSEDLGVILEITPRITRDDHVVLAVDQSIKARTGDLLGSLETPVLSNREVTTSVNVRNGDTVVIGGLLSEEEQLSESRIPLLSDIPGLGRLFRSKRRSSRKTNLMIFLTPHIVRDDAEARQLAARGRDEISEQVDRSRAHPRSTIRQVFRPGRSLGRYRVEDPPELPFSTGDGTAATEPRSRAARTEDLDRLVEEIRRTIEGTGPGGSG